MDLCSGGMIWACCIDGHQTINQNDHDQSQQGALLNASEYAY